jgi:hypothetical protein
MKRDDDGNLTCTLTMTAFIDGMVESFKSHLPDKIVSTPFPEGQVIINDKSTGEEEANEVLEMGYMRACGMVLWAQRTYSIRLSTSVPPVNGAIHRTAS